MTFGGQRRPAVPRNSSVFARILIGVDETESSLEACRQAARLVEPDGCIEALFAVDIDPSHIDEALEREANAALREAEKIIGPHAKSRLAEGWPKESLLSEVDRRRVTLVAVGTHQHRRMTEILIAGTVGSVLHDAPCSVLIARPPVDTMRFPQSIVAGVDGSPEADAALSVAKDVAARFAVPLRVVVALAGKTADLAEVMRTAPFAETVNEPPVGALVDAGKGADLVVVGSRGLHGIRALGSVSERVAFECPRSVLVVRQRNEDRLER